MANHQGILYKLFSVSIGGSVLSILTQSLSNLSQHVMVYGCLSKLVNVVSGVAHGYVLGPLLFLLDTSELFFILETKVWSVVILMTPLWWQLCTMHLQQSPRLTVTVTIGRTELKGSYDLVILRVTFYSKMTLEKYLKSVSKAAAQRLDILKPLRVFCSLILWDAFGVLSFPFWSIVLQCGPRLPMHTLNHWTVQSVVPGV